jgi:hypothetical protein
LRRAFARTVIQESGLLNRKTTGLGNETHNFYRRLNSVHGKSAAGEMVFSGPPLLRTSACSRFASPGASKKIQQKKLTKITNRFMFAQTFVLKLLLKCTQPTK